MQAASKFSLADSVMYIESGLAHGEMRVTEAIKQGMFRLRQLEQQDEAMLLEEAEMLGVAGL